MRFDTTDADPDASSHADSGNNPHSHANAYPNPSPNRYSHAYSDANPHSHANVYSNTNADSRANANSRANAGADVSTNASANTRNARASDRHHAQPHRLNARPRGGLLLFGSSAGPWASIANVGAPLPHAHERSARDAIEPR